MLQTIFDWLLPNWLGDVNTHSILHPLAFTWCAQFAPLLHFSGCVIVPCAHVGWLQQSEFQTQKEAAWAISNLTISGRKEQVGIRIHVRIDFIVNNVKSVHWVC